MGNIGKLIELRRRSPTRQGGSISDGPALEAKPWTRFSRPTGHSRSELKVAGASPERRKRESLLPATFAKLQNGSGLPDPSFSGLVGIVPPAGGRPTVSRRHRFRALSRLRSNRTGIADARWRCGIGEGDQKRPTENHIRGSRNADPEPSHKWRRSKLLSRGRVRSGKPTGRLLTIYDEVLRLVRLWQIYPHRATRQPGTDLPNSIGQR